MRRSLALAAVVTVIVVAAPLRAQDEDKANESWKAITDWLEGQQPNTAEDRKNVRAELVQKLRAFLKEFPKAKTALAARGTLADALVQDKKLDEALSIYEELAKSQDEKWGPWAKLEVVRTLIEKRDYAKARAKLDPLEKDMAGDARVAKLDEALKQREGMHAAVATVKVAAAPPELKAKALAGSDVDLAAWKGKVVLVDFWATWCPPCKAELPNLKKLYADLHAKGLEIVGVDGVEKDPAKLKDFLAQQQIAWPQIVEQGKPIARAYGVEALPRSVLVGKDGLVAALNLRGEKLAKAVRALVADKPIPADETPDEGDEGKGKADEGDK